MYTYIYVYKVFFLYIYIGIYIYIYQETKKLTYMHSNLVAAIIIFETDHVAQ